MSSFKLFLILDQEAISLKAYMHTVPTEKQRSRIAQFIGKEYHSLAIELGLSQVMLDHIDMNEKVLTAQDKITAILNLWVKMKTNEATFEELKRAMARKGIDWMSIFSGITNELTDC